MRRRVLGSIVLVTTVAVALFGIPLGIAARGLYRSQEIGRLQREATLAAGPLPSLNEGSGERVRLPEGANGRSLAAYDSGARLVSGNGPIEGSKAVHKALSGTVGETEQQGELRVAVPILADAQVFGAVEVSMPLSAIDERVHRTWAAMAGLGVLAIVVAAGLARWQARRLAEPIVELADVLARLGQGDFSARLRHYGIGEVDAAAVALDATATRLGSVLERERAFSANVSHQLSTPLTGLRLALESALLTSQADLEPAVVEALSEVTRLQGTVAELLALARDVKRRPYTMNLDRLFSEVERAWRLPLAAEGRVLQVCLPGIPVIHGSATAIREILDVLVGNALRHGAGTVTLRAHRAGEGVVIEVEDEGEGVSDMDELFERQPASRHGHGIGLALARSLAQAEGGRLLLRSLGPRPVFAVVLSGGATTDVSAPFVANRYFDVVSTRHRNPTQRYLPNEQL